MEKARQVSPPQTTTIYPQLFIYLRKRKFSQLTDFCLLAAAPLARSFSRGQQSAAQSVIAIFMESGKVKGAEPANVLKVYVQYLHDMRFASRDFTLRNGTLHSLLSRAESAI